MNNTITLPLPCGTEATIEFGGMHFSGWAPTRSITQADQEYVTTLFRAVGCGEVTAECQARRWAHYYGEEFAPEPGGRKPRPEELELPAGAGRPTFSDVEVAELFAEALAPAEIGEEMSLSERRPALY